MKLSNVDHPLYELLRKHVKWKWNEECQRAFESAKHLFIQTVVLQHPMMDRASKVNCDASYYGISCVISPFDDEGNEKIVTCGSRTMRQAELNYHTTEKELLAIIWSIDWRACNSRGTSL